MNINQTGLVRQSAQTLLSCVEDFEECIFIPEEISIDAHLTNSKMENDRFFYFEAEPPPFKRVLLGNVFTVNRCNLNSAKFQKILSIPDETKSFPVLKLFTTVRVFGNEVLTDNDSSITLPKQYYDFRNQKAQKVAFWYEQGEKPRIESKVVNQTILYEFISS